MDLTHIEHKSVRRALRLDEPIPEALLQKAHQHFQHCQSCQQLIRESSQLRKAADHYLQANHPDADAILQYLSEKKQAEQSGETFTPESTAREVLAHLQECSLCRKRLAYYRQASDAAEQIAANVLNQAQLEAQPLRPAASLLRFLPRWDGKSQRMITSLLLAACLSVFYFAGVGVRQIRQSPFDRLGSLANEDFASFLRRGAPTSARSEASRLEEIEQSLRAQDFQQAQDSVEQFIVREDPSGYSLLRARLYDLFASLKLAQNSVWNPLVPRYDTAIVAAALARSEAVVALAATDTVLSRTQTYYLTHYYLAKGYLILHDPVRASAHLSAAATHDNYRKARAKQIKDELDQALNLESE